MKVPNHQPADRVQRMLEILVGALPFVLIALVVVLSRWAPELAACLILIFAILWFIRLLGYARRLSLSFYYQKLARIIDWNKRLFNSGELPDRADFWNKQADKWYKKLLNNGKAVDKPLEASQIYHAVIIALYNESFEVVESAMQAISASHYNSDRIIVLIAYEERGGKTTEANAKRLIKNYGSKFHFAKAIKHPDDIPGEAKAKAGNITFAAKYLSQYCRDNNIVPENVLVTTLDADHCPHPQYFACLSTIYTLTNKRTQQTYQPIPLFNNNIWDAPALVRVVASDTSFWSIMETVRTRRLRPFASHAQSLRTLQDTDYWNVETIVEDGHQLWRTYFTYDGDHQTLPIWLPINQDAVLSSNWWKTMVAQAKQLERWAWSVSDTPFIIRQSFRAKQIRWRSKLYQIWRQLDDYMAWSVAPIILILGGWLPKLLGTNQPQSYLVARLPFIMGILGLVALVFLIIPVVASLLILPHRPARYGKSRNLAMVLQWFLEPVALIIFVACMSLWAHARLLFNKPLERFNVTEKARK